MLRTLQQHAKAGALHLANAQRVAGLEQSPGGRLRRFVAFRLDSDRGHGGRGTDVQTHKPEGLQVVLGPLQREDRSTVIGQVARRGCIAVGIDGPASRLHVAGNCRLMRQCRRLHALFRHDSHVPVPHGRPARVLDHRRSPSVQAASRALRARKTKTCRQTDARCSGVAGLRGPATRTSVLYGSMQAPASAMPSSGARIMTFSIAPGLESNGIWRATVLTRGASIPSAEPTSNRIEWLWRSFRRAVTHAIRVRLCRLCLKMLTRGQPRSHPWTFSARSAVHLPTPSIRVSPSFSNMPPEQPGSI
jgi:hypothetical protein